MKIEATQVTKLLLTEVDALDPITVILEDLGPRQGKITIECYGDAWSAYWGGMGDKTIAQFFCSCNEDYIAENLSNISQYVTDYEAISEQAKTEISDSIKTLLSDRRDNLISKEVSRTNYDQLKNAIDDIPNICDRHDLECNREFMQETFGEEWWYVLPEKINHKYEYLCRIITAVQQGLNLESASKATGE